MKNKKLYSKQYNIKTLTMNTIVLQLSDAVADISMLQCSAQFRILFINAHFVVDNATHALASSATERPTFNVEEEDVVIRNGWTPKEERYLQKNMLNIYCIRISVHDIKIRKLQHKL